MIRTRKFGAGLLVLALLVGASLAIGPARVGTVIAEEGPWVLNPANGHYYGMIEPTSWTDAEAQAIEWGGHLATINDRAEELWLKEQFGTAYRFWIGFNDREEEGNWVWSSGESVTYTNWCPGEPNDCCTEEEGEENAAVMNATVCEDGWNDLIDWHHHRAIVEIAFQVSVDIKPGSYPNSINLGSKGVVPVAVLTTDEFDAGTVDPVTLDFTGAAPLRWAWEDVDDDGDVDILFHFNTQELNLDENSTEASLTGETFDGQPFGGTDSVNIVP